MKKLSHKVLMKHLSYDRQSGIFTWNDQLEHRFRGKIAGKINANGYVHIKIEQTWYYAHRLAWFYVHKRWPKHDIDHVNRIKSDNRIANLRPATNSQNGWNSGKRRNNKSGYKWVVKDGGNFVAVIRDGKRARRFGPFSTAEEAYAAAVNFAMMTHKEYFRGA